MSLNIKFLYLFHSSFFKLKVELFLFAGFFLRHRKEHDIWQEVTLGRSNRTYTAAGLQCGTSYKFGIHAINSVGRSESSNVVEAKTNGSGE